MKVYLQNPLVKYNVKLAWDGEVPTDWKLKYYGDNKKTIKLPELKAIAVDADGNDFMDISKYGKFSWKYPNMVISEDNTLSAVLGFDGDTELTVDWTPYTKWDVTGADFNKLYGLSDGYSAFVWSDVVEKPQTLKQPVTVEKTEMPVECKLYDISGTPREIAAIELEEGDINIELEKKFKFEAKGVQSTGAEATTISGGEWRFAHIDQEGEVEDVFTLRHDEETDSWMLSVGENIQPGATSILRAYYKVDKSSEQYFGNQEKEFDIPVKIIAQTKAFTPEVTATFDGGSYYVDRPGQEDLDEEFRNKDEVLCFINEAKFDIRVRQTAEKGGHTYYTLDGSDPREDTNEARIEYTSDEPLVFTNSDCENGKLTFKIASVSEQFASNTSELLAFEGEYIQVENFFRTKKIEVEDPENPEEPTTQERYVATEKDTVESFNDITDCILDVALEEGENGFVETWSRKRANKYPQAVSIKFALLEDGQTLDKNSRDNHYASLEDMFVNFSNMLDGKNLKLYAWASCGEANGPEIYQKVSIDAPAAPAAPTFAGYMEGNVVYNDQPITIKPAEKCGVLYGIDEEEPVNEVPAEGISFTEKEIGNHTITAVSYLLNYPRVKSEPATLDLTVMADLRTTVTVGKLIFGAEYGITDFNRSINAVYSKKDLSKDAPENASNYEQGGIISEFTPGNNVYTYVEKAAIDPSVDSEIDGAYLYVDKNSSVTFKFKLDEQEVNEEGTEPGETVEEGTEPGETVEEGTEPGETVDNEPAKGKKFTQVILCAKPNANKKLTVKVNGTEMTLEPGGDVGGYREYSFVMYEPKGETSLEGTSSEPKVKDTHESLVIETGTQCALQILSVRFDWTTTRAGLPKIEITEDNKVEITKGFMGDKSTQWCFSKENCKEGEAPADAQFVEYEGAFEAPGIGYIYAKSQSNDLIWSKVAKYAVRGALDAALQVVEKIAANDDATVSLKMKDGSEIEFEVKNLKVELLDSEENVVEDAVTGSWGYNRTLNVKTAGTYTLKASWEKSELYNAGECQATVKVYAPFNMEAVTTQYFEIDGESLPVVTVIPDEEPYDPEQPLPVPLSAGLTDPDGEIYYQILDSDITYEVPTPLAEDGEVSMANGWFPAYDGKIGHIGTSQKIRFVVETNGVQSEPIKLLTVLDSWWDPQRKEYKPTVDIDKDLLVVPNKSVTATLSVAINEMPVANAELVLLDMEGNEIDRTLYSIDDKSNKQKPTINVTKAGEYQLALKWDRNAEYKPGSVKAENSFKVYAPFKLNDVTVDATNEGESIKVYSYESTEAGKNLADGLSDASSKLYIALDGGEEKEYQKNEDGTFVIEPAKELGTMKIRTLTNGVWSIVYDCWYASNKAWEETLGASLGDVKLSIAGDLRLEEGKKVQITLNYKELGLDKEKKLPGVVTLVVAEKNGKVSELTDSDPDYVNFSQTGYGYDVDFKVAGEYTLRFKYTGNTQYKAGESLPSDQITIYVDPHFEDNLVGLTFGGSSLKGQTTTKVNDKTVKGLVFSSEKDHKLTVTPVNAEATTEIWYRSFEYTPTEVKAAVRRAVAEEGEAEGEAEDAVEADPNDFKKLEGNEIALAGVHGTLEMYLIKNGVKSNVETAVYTNDESLLGDISTGIEGVDAELEGAEYYDLNGYRVNGDELKAGIYVRVLNGKATKVIVR